MLNNAVILAGGKSSRMGEDKALLPFGNFKTLTEYQIAKLSPLFKNIYISSKSNKFDFDAKIILDSYKDSSPLVAIASILQELKEDFFLISVDIPLVPIDDIKNLLESYEKSKNYEIYLIESQNGLEPTVAIYTRKILPIALKMIKNGDHKLKNMINSSKKYLLKTENSRAYLNVNDKNGYKMALNYCKKCEKSVKN